MQAGLKRSWVIVKDGYSRVCSGLRCGTGNQLQDGGPVSGGDGLLRRSFVAYQGYMEARSDTCGLLLRSLPDPEVPGLDSRF